MGNGAVLRLRSLCQSKFWIIVTLLLCVLAARQVVSALQETETADEGAHLVAGYSYWKTRDFRLLPSHPPLAELFCALPLLLLKPDFSPPPDAWRDADEYAIAKEFLYHNRIDADTLLFAGRMMAILATLVFGLALAWWTRQRFGAAPAVFSLLLFSSLPSIIAHGRYVTTDFMVSAFLFGSCVSWLSYLESGSLRKLLLTGLLTGLTLDIKFNGLILYPIFFLLILLYLWRTPVSLRHRQSVAALLLALLLVPFLIVYSSFFFDTKSVLQDPRLGPRLERRLQGRVRTIAAIPVPAYYYARGLHILARDLKGGHPTYLLGKNSDRGTWLYFPVAFVVKSPLGFLLLLALCVPLAMRRLRQRPPFAFVWVALGIPPLFYFLVSLTSSMNIGIRHILPVYPFLAVLIGAALFHSDHGRYTVSAQIAGMVFAALLVVESFAIHPHYLAFFNLMAGGPQNGPRYLIDSNVDWGQDLKKLKWWADRNSAGSLCLSYFGQADPAYYGISYSPLGSVRDKDELANLDCVAAVSAHYLFGSGYRRYRALRQLTPTERVGYSIYVYDLRKKRVKSQVAAVGTPGFLRW